MIGKTNPPGKLQLLYDGHCLFCTAGAERLRRLAKPDSIQFVSFQDPGALAPFPGLTFDQCMKQMILVSPEGEMYGGFEAAVLALKTRPWLGIVANLYYVPGLRWLIDRLYEAVAERRYRIMGRAIESGACADGACKLHFPNRGENRTPPRLPTS